MLYQQYITTFQSNEGTPPIIIDENGCLEILTTMTSKHLTSLDECRTGEFSTISLYEIQEERKLFDIMTVKHCIRDISLIPYEGKHIYILRSIDKGTPEAMNALLKSLEECPRYASIILVVDDPEALLETIRSRCMNFYRDSSIGTLSEKLRASFDAYTHGEVRSFAGELYTSKIEKGEAIALLRYALTHGTGEYIDSIEQGIIDIRMSHGAPRNILDSIFFIPR